MIFSVHYSTIYVSDIVDIQYFNEKIQFEIMLNKFIKGTFLGVINF